jgi:hypothetical protein
MNGVQVVRAVSRVGLFEPPLVVPGLDKALLELLILLGVILGSVVLVTVSSVVGLIRAVRRRRRGGRSKAAVVLAAIATAIAASWLVYWTGDAIRHRSNPINGFLTINFAICVPPLSWLIAAIRANAARREEAK